MTNTKEKLTISHLNPTRARTILKNSGLKMGTIKINWDKYSSSILLTTLSGYTNKITTIDDLYEVVNHLRK